MIKESKYFEVEYTDNDIAYIDRMLEDIDAEAERILSFFNINNYNEKFHLILIPTKKEFSNTIRELIHFEDDQYGIGFVKDRIMYCLSYLDYKSTYYKDYNYDDFIKTIIHEFIHACHSYVKKGMSIRCINEGLACYLSNQYDNNKELTFDASLEDLINDKMVNYDNYYLLMKYIFENYEREYIDKIIYDKIFAREEIVKIYNRFNNGLERK